MVDPESPTVIYACRCGHRMRAPSRLKLGCSLCGKPMWPVTGAGLIGQAGAIPGCTIAARVSGRADTMRWEAAERFAWSVASPPARTPSHVPARSYPSADLPVDPPSEPNPNPDDGPLAYHHGGVWVVAESLDRRQFTVFSGADAEGRAARYREWLAADGRC